MNFLRIIKDNRQDLLLIIIAASLFKMAFLGINTSSSIYSEKKDVRLDYKPLYIDGTVKTSIWGTVSTEVEGIVNTETVITNK